MLKEDNAMLQCTLNVLYTALSYLNDVYYIVLSLEFFDITPHLEDSGKFNGISNSLAEYVAITPARNLLDV